MVAVGAAAVAHASSSVVVAWFFSVDRRESAYGSKACTATLSARDVGSPRTVAGVLMHAVDPSWPLSFQRHGL